MNLGQLTVGGVTFDLKLLLFIVLGTVVPMLDYYGHRLTNLKAYDRMIYYFILPMLLIVLLFREPPAKYGFQVGNWKAGLAWTAVTAIVMAVILWYVARTPDMQKYYNAHAPKEIMRLITLNGIDLFGWEFIWRGFLLFGIARILGPGPAIMIQAIPFAFMHLGKPELETLSTIFGGIGFGFIAWQTQSFVYPWLIHWFITSFTMLIASGKI